MRLQPLGHLSGENLLRNELALRRLFHRPERLNVQSKTLFRHLIELSLDSMGESCQPQLERARQKQSVIGNRLRNTFGEKFRKTFSIQESGSRIKVQEDFTGEDEETREETDGAPAPAPAAAALACPFAGTEACAEGIGGTLVLSTTW